jgi:ArsR family transcriptional regulator
MDVDMAVELRVIDSCRPLGTPALADNEAEATAQVFKALGDPARVKIVSVIAAAGEPVCACEFPSALALSQATVSHHLKKLTDVGLLEREQRGKWAYFSLNPEALVRLESLVQIPKVA